MSARFAARRLRMVPGGDIFHLLNRANFRSMTLPKGADDTTFEGAMAAT